MAVPDTALLALLGSRDESLRTAEELLDADVHVRGNEITLEGREAEQVGRLFEEMVVLLQQGQVLEPAAVRRSSSSASPSGIARPCRAARSASIEETLSPT